MAVRVGIFATATGQAPAAFAYIDAVFGQSNMTGSQSGISGSPASPTTGTAISTANWSGGDATNPNFGYYGNGLRWPEPATANWWTAASGTAESDYWKAGTDQDGHQLMQWAVGDKTIGETRTAASRLVKAKERLSFPLSQNFDPDAPVTWPVGPMVPALKVLGQDAHYAGAAMNILVPTARFAKGMTTILSSLQDVPIWQGEYVYGDDSAGNTTFSTLGAWECVKVGGVWKRGPYAKHAFLAMQALFDHLTSQGITPILRSIIGPPGEDDGSGGVRLHRIRQLYKDYVACVRETFAHPSRVPVALFGTMPQGWVDQGTTIISKQAVQAAQRSVSHYIDHAVCAERPPHPYDATGTGTATFDIHSGIPAAVKTGQRMGLGAPLARSRSSVMVPPSAKPPADFCALSLWRPLVSGFTGNHIECWKEGDPTTTFTQFPFSASGTFDYDAIGAYCAALTSGKVRARLLQQVSGGPDFNTGSLVTSGAPPDPTKWPVLAIDGQIVMRDKSPWLKFEAAGGLWCQAQMPNNAGLHIAMYGVPTTNNTIFAAGNNASSQSTLIRTGSPANYISVGGGSSGRAVAVSGLIASHRSDTRLLMLNPQETGSALWNNGVNVNNVADGTYTSAAVNSAGWLSIGARVTTAAGVVSQTTMLTGFLSELAISATAHDTAARSNGFAAMDWALLDHFAYQSDAINLTP